MVLTIQPSTGYTVGTPARAVVSIADNDGPSPIPLSGPAGLIGTAPGQPACRRTSRLTRGSACSTSRAVTRGRR